jgi:GNAT superfamily N-acetyltransferase
MMLQVVQARTETELQQVKILFYELVEFYSTGIDAGLANLNDSPAMTGYADELETLPGIYSLPDGRLLLAYYDANIAGCVALKKFADGVCELKRLWVRPSFRGKGIGKVLVESLINEARGAGYNAMILETEFTLKSARAIYEELGFEKTKPYFDGPEDILRRSVFMRLELGS